MISKSKKVYQKLGKSREDYLEAVLIVINKNKVCKSVDVAKILNVSKPSVSIAIKQLIDDDFLEKCDEGYILLTKTGYDIANAVLERHNFFKKLLIKAKVNEKIAENDACLMEHVISSESFNKLKILLSKLL